MNGDRLIRAGTAAAVLVVATIAAVVSFVHIEHLALTHGQALVAAVLLPVSIDGTVAAASLVMLRAARDGLGTPVLARFMLVLAVGATLAANVGYGLPYGLAGAALSGWPAVAFIGCAEMAIGMVRRARAPRQVYGTSVQPPVPAALANGHSAPEGGREAAELFAGGLASGDVPSIRRIRAGLHIGQPRAREIQAYLETLTPDGQSIRRIRGEIRQGAPLPEDSPAGASVPPAPGPPAGVTLNGGKPRREVTHG